MGLNWSIQHRRDTLANWIANDPVLLAGQECIVTDAVSDSVKIKYGTGAIWSLTPYYNPASSSQTLKQTLGFGSVTDGYDFILSDDDKIFIGSDSSRYINYSTSTIIAGLQIVNNNSNDHIILQDAGGIHVDTPYIELPQYTASTVPYIDSSNKLVSSAVTPTELGYLSGVTSALQTQLNAKELSANKAIDFTTINDTLYPTTKAVTTKLNSYELAISASTTSKYWRGDKTFVDFMTDVRGTTLTGLSVTGGTVVSTDTVLQAFGKVQNQINTVSKTLTIDTQTITGTSMTLPVNPSFIYAIYCDRGYLTPGIDYTRIGTAITFTDTLAAASVTTIMEY